MLINNCEIDITKYDKIRIKGVQYWIDEENLLL